MFPKESRYPGRVANKNFILLHPLDTFFLHENQQSISTVQDVSTNKAPWAALGSLRATFGALGVPGIAPLCCWSWGCWSWAEQSRQGWALSTGNNWWQDVFCIHISLNTFLSAISASHPVMVCVEKCFQGMAKKEWNQFCDLVRSTEEFKISGSKESSATPFPCVYKSMNVPEKWNVGRRCKNPLQAVLLVEFPSLCAMCWHRTEQPWREFVTSWKCSFQATGVQDVQAAPLALKGLCSANLIFAESFCCRLSMGRFLYSHNPATGGRAGHSQWQWESETGAHTELF